MKCPKQVKLLAVDHANLELLSESSLKEVARVIPDCAVLARYSATCLNPICSTVATALIVQKNINEVFGIVADDTAMT